MQQQKRIEKAMTERFFLLDVRRQTDITWKLSGSKFDVYTIVVDGQYGRIKCDCPDSFSHAKRHGCLCKHACFIILRVLKYTDNAIFRQHAVNRQVLHRLKTCNERSLRDPNVESPFLTERYLEMKDADPLNGDTLFEQAVQGTEECPVCYEMTKADVLNCVCPVCKKVFHKECMDRWLHNTVGSATCPMCRSSVWGQYKAPKGVDGGRQYTNLLM